MLIVEIDGATHSTDSGIASDAERSAWLIANSHRSIRVTNQDVYENTDGVMELKFAAAHELGCD